MLIVKTYLDKSTIPGAGLGLFAGQFIRKGQIIWQYEEGLDVSIKIEDFEAVKQIYPKFVGFFNKYGYIEDGQIIVGLDNDRFINHSDNPNIDDSRPFVSIAKRNIQKGEELFSDYAKLGRNKEGLIILK